MAYRENPNSAELRYRELVGELEIVEQRAREYPYLEWKKKELMRELAILSDGALGSLNGRKKPRTRRGVVKQVLGAFFLLLCSLFLVFVALRTIGPQISKAGTPNVSRLDPG